MLIVSRPRKSVSASPAAASIIAPKRREEEERVELAALEVVLGEVAAGEQRREGAAEAEQHVEEEREAIEDQPRRDGRRVAEPLDADHPQRGGEGGAGEEDGRGAEGEAARGRVVCGAGENASTSMSSSAPMPTTRSGESARAMDMADPQ